MCCFFIKLARYTAKGISNSKPRFNGLRIGRLEALPLCGILYVLPGGKDLLLPTQRRHGERDFLQFMLIFRQLFAQALEILHIAFLLTQLARFFLLRNYLG